MGLENHLGALATESRLQWLRREHPRNAKDASLPKQERQHELCRVSGIFQSERLLN